MADNGSNVIRFPVERRAVPSLGLLAEIAPDCREVWRAIKAFDIELEQDPADMRAGADRAAAERIRDEVPPEPGSAWQCALTALLAPLVNRAVTLCAQASEARAAAEMASARLETARAEGGYRTLPHEHRAASLAETAARQLVDAYLAYEEAAGAARAVRLARADEIWRPFDLHAEASALLFR
jgi:hypothetical protein